MLMAVSLPATSCATRRAARARCRSRRPACLASASARSQASSSSAGSARARTISRSSSSSRNALGPKPNAIQRLATCRTADGSAAASARHMPPIRISGWRSPDAATARCRQRCTTTPGCCRPRRSSAICVPFRFSSCGVSSQRSSRDGGTIDIRSPCWRSVVAMRSSAHSMSFRRRRGGSASTVTATHHASAAGGCALLEHFVDGSARQFDAGLIAFAERGEPFVDARIRRQWLGVRDRRRPDDGRVRRRRDADRAPRRLQLLDRRGA